MFKTLFRTLKQPLKRAALFGAFFVMGQSAWARAADAPMNNTAPPSYKQTAITAAVKQNADTAMQAAVKKPMKIVYETIRAVRHNEAVNASGGRFTTQAEITDVVLVDTNGKEMHLAKAELNTPVITTRLASSVDKRGHVTEHVVSRNEGKTYGLTKEYRPQTYAAATKPKQVHHNTADICQKGPVAKSPVVAAAKPAAEKRTTPRPVITDQPLKAISVNPNRTAPPQGLPSFVEYIGTSADMVLAVDLGSNPFPQAKTVAHDNGTVTYHFKSNKTGMTTTHSNESFGPNSTTTSAGENFAYTYTYKPR